MSASALAFLWTYSSLITSAGALALMALLRRQKTLIAVSLLVNALCSYCLSESVTATDANDAYALWPPIGFAVIDYTCGVLALAAGEVVIALLFGLSVLNHGIFCVYAWFTPAPVSQADMIAQFHARMTYGWTAFAFTILPSILLIGGGNDGGGRRNRVYSWCRSGRVVLRGNLVARRDSGEMAERPRGRPRRLVERKG